MTYQRSVLWRLLQASVTFLLCGATAACGYHFQGSGTILPEDIKTVKVRPVANDTTIQGIGLELEESIRSTFDSFGVLTVVDENEPADAVAEARIINVERRVRNVTGATDIALEYDLVMTVQAELRRSSGQVLYRNTRLQASQSFASTSDVVVTSSSQFAQGGIGANSLTGLESNELARGQERVALNDVIEQVSRRFYIEAVAADF